MKILQIISGREVNGAVTYVRFLADQLHTRGVDVSVLHRADSWIGEQPATTYRRHQSELTRTPRELKRIARLIQDERFDLVHTHMSRAHFFGVLLRPLINVPVVATAHSCTFQLHWRFNDFVIANSEATLRYQRRINRIPAANSRCIHCFTDLDRFMAVTRDDGQDVRRRVRFDRDDFVVGVVGQVGKRKGQRHLFRALPHLFNQIPRLKVLVVGEFDRTDPYVRRLRAMQLENGWTGRIRWLGRCNQVPDTMAAMDVCVVPSEREPLGLVALEAMAAGTPVVATRTGGLPEIVRDGVTGRLVSPRDSRALAEAIIAMARQPEQRAQFAAKALDFVTTRFAPARLTDQVMGVYQEVLERRARRSLKPQRVA